jgi:hypothetical protein
MTLETFFKQCHSLDGVKGNPGGNQTGKGERQRRKKDRDRDRSSFFFLCLYLKALSEAYLPSRISFGPHYCLVGEE